MVRHQTVRKQSNWKAVHRRDHDSFKRDVIFRFGKQFVSSVRPIKGMIRDLGSPEGGAGGEYSSGENFHAVSG
jgi:hypothetical protein